MKHTLWILGASLGAAFSFVGCGGSDAANLTGDKPPIVDAGPDVPDAVACGAGQAACGGACTELKTDPENCGACDRRCDLNESCVDGACHPACTGDTIECDGVCVDPFHDPSHCGGCGGVCGPSEVCDSGLCSLTCGGGSTKCGSACVDVKNDPANCGACGTHCAAGEVCVNGACGLQCPPGTIQCGGQCLDTSNDPDNCGACNTTCPSGELCSAGKCGVICLGGTVLCNGKCVDTAHDPDNCGSCGKICGVGYDCVAGKCAYTCGTDSLLCGADCVSPLTDPSNCGGCGKKCPTGQVCNNGTCSLDCGSLTACSAQCVDIQSDTKNCGACAKLCAPGEVCVAGQCGCPSGYDSCLGKCIDVQTDPLNCGACGVGCGDDEVCTAGVCVCKPGWTSCGGTCVDTKTSSQNCGACGTTCVVGKVCTAGGCATSTGQWNTLGFDVAHTGENTAELGKPPLYLAWTHEVLENIALNPVVVAGGRVFATASAYFGTLTPLVALNASDGTKLWDYNFGDIFSVGQPATFGGYVYVPTGKGTSGLPYVWKFDAAAGTTSWSATMNAQWEHYWAPIVVNGVVYSNGGTYGGLYGFANTDGAQLFFQSLDQYDEWSPAYGGGSVLTFVKGILRAHDPAAGTVSWSTTVTWNWSGYAMKTAPAVAYGRAYVIAPPNLYAVNLTTHAVDWTANGTYAGMAAVAGNVVYGLSAKHLVARNADTGALVGTFAGDGQLSYPPVIAGNYVYAASDSNVYAVDRTTLKSVWTAASGGWLTIADKRLFVAKSNGTLEAYVFEN